VTRSEAEEMADRMNHAAPAGVRYEVGETDVQLELGQEAPRVPPFFVRRVVARWARRGDSRSER
jgi:hypothetical protein